MAMILEKPNTAIPTPSDTELAKEASRAIATNKPAELRVRMDNGQELLLPRAATRLMHHLLTEMAQGNAVTIIPIHAQLTTQEAADFLNVSRPYLIRLLEEKSIPFHRVGSHRRICFQDLEAFKKVTEEKRQAAMNELAAQAQEEDMGY
jgi:excisionase family DNA binding protein